MSCYDKLVETAKSAPAVLVSAIAWLTQIPLNSWVAFSTLCYVVGQFVVLVRREVRDTRAAAGLAYPERRRPKGVVRTVAKAVLKMKEHKSDADQ
jgi:uncharacterized membrane protein